MVNKYRKKPVIIEAIQYTGKNLTEIFKLGMETLEQGFLSSDLIIPTLEGNMVAKPGDYIIRGIKGEFYPCKPDIFEQSYELVESKDV